MVSLRQGNFGGKGVPCSGLLSIFGFGRDVFVPLRYNFFRFFLLYIVLFRRRNSIFRWSSALLFAQRLPTRETEEDKSGQGNQVCNSGILHSRNIGVQINVRIYVMIWMLAPLFSDT